MLGVVMGVGVLMLVAALLTGFNQSVVETITRFGADTASVTRFSQVALPLPVVPESRSQAQAQFDGKQSRTGNCLR